MSLLDVFCWFVHSECKLVVIYNYICLLESMDVMQGKSSAEIPQCLGYNGPEEAVHRANISLLVLSNPLSASLPSLDDIPASSASKPSVSDGMPAAAARHELVGNAGSHQPSQYSSTTGSHETDGAGQIRDSLFSEPFATHQGGHKGVSPSVGSSYRSKSTAQPPGAANQVHHEMDHPAAVMGSAGLEQLQSERSSSMQHPQAVPHTPEERLALLKYDILKP